MAANKIAPVLITCTQSSYSEEASLLLKVKELIVWFCHTLSVSITFACRLEHVVCLCGPAVVIIAVVYSSNLSKNLIIVFCTCVYLHCTSIF